MSAGLRVLRHESELASWELVSRAPAAPLRHVVWDYQGYVETSTGPPVTRQQMPTTRIPLIVNFGARWRVADERGDGDLADSFVAGLHRRSVYVSATGPAACVQIDLTPLGARALLGQPMHELADHVVGLDDLLPAAQRGLAERIEDAGSWEERFALLDRALAKRLAGAKPPSQDVVWAWSILERSHGRASIGALADRLGRSRKHLVARFREHVGLPPKTAARIFRFNRALRLLRELPADGLAELAFECGYYDQAHLNRDFRAFAGTSPGELARRIGPDGAVLA
jgi:AraC-like DNA-binding protein